MDSIWSVLDVVFVGAGLYTLYAWIMMKTRGEIKKSILMNEDVNLKKCKDLEGYKKYIGPRMLVFGIVAILYGASGLVNTYVTPIPSLIYGIIMAVFLAILCWFAVGTRNGIQKFW